jgi:MEKHLA domain
MPIYLNTQSNLRMEAPAINNDYYLKHVAIMLENLTRWTGYDLIKEYGFSLTNLGEQVFNADFYILSHNHAADPILNYGNQRVLELWELSWTELTSMYSRDTAKSIDRAARSAMMERVKSQNYISGYSGMRIGKTGKEFKILDVTIWNLFDRDEPYGQAAWFRSIAY